MTKSKRELEQLRKENADLRREQDLMYLLMETVMAGMDKKLSDLKQDVDQSNANGGNQIGMLFNQVGKTGKEATRDRLLAFFEGLK